MPAKPKGTAQTTRMRKVTCERCGYTVRLTRSWMQVGLPACPNPGCTGGELVPTAPADLALLGRLTQDDMSGPEWTAVCRANGWTDAINRPKGTAARMRGRPQEQRRRTPVHCAHPGCGAFVREGREHCAAHGPADAVPF